MLFKFNKFVVLFLSFIISVSACGNYNNNISETTIAGATQTPVLSGENYIWSHGEPFTEEEISTAVELIRNLDWIDENCNVSKSGYYHVFERNKWIDYTYFTMLVFKEGTIFGEVELEKTYEGKIQIESSKEFRTDNKLEEMLRKFPNLKFALVYCETGEYAIAEDNTVTVLSGQEPLLDNCDTLFETYDMKDNVISFNTYKEYL